MSTSDYLVGAVELAVIAGALGFGAYRLRAWILPGWSGAPARLAEVVLAISMLVICAQLLGLAGLFSGGWLVAGSLAAGLGAAVLARRRAADSAPIAVPPAPRPAAWMLPLAVAVSALVVAHWAVPVQHSLETGMYRQDSTWYHMPFSARFVQDGQLGNLHLTDTLELAAWFYPLNSELVHGVGIAAFGSDFLSLFINLGWLALALLAAWCIGRPYGLGALTLVGAAIVLDAEMMVHAQAGNAPSDVPSLFFLLAVLALLVNADAAVRARAAPGEEAPGGAGSPGGSAAHAGGTAGSAVGAATEERPSPERSRADSARRSVRRVFGPLTRLEHGPLFLGALAAGLAVGTKITLLPVIGVLTVVLIAFAGRGDRLRTGGIWIGGTALTAGFWYARNLVHAGNPLPWISFGPLNLPSPDQLPYYPRPAHSVAEYLDTPYIWRDSFIPALDNAFGPLWFAMLIAVALGLFLSVIRSRTPLLRALGGIGIIATIVYFLTPVSASGPVGNPTGFEANLRYVAPALLIGLTLLPLVPFLRRRAPLVLGALLVVFAVGAVISPTWDALDASRLLGAIILAGALVLLPVAVVVGGRRGASAPALLGSAAATFALLVAIGYPIQRDYVDDRYALDGVPPVLDNPGFRSQPEWVPVQEWAKPITDSRIALVGPSAAFGQFVFYGDDLSNRVQYLGETGPNGTHRPLVTCARWREAINEGDFDYVVTTPTFEQGNRPEPLETMWTRRDPAVREVVRSSPTSVFAIEGRLDPGGCPDGAGSRIVLEEN